MRDVSGGLLIDPTCPHCGLAVESLEFLILSYQISVDVWEHISVELQFTWNYLEE